MFTDALLELDPAYTALTASRASTNHVRFGAGDRGVCVDNYILIRVGTAFTTGSTSTLTVGLQTDDNTSFSSATTILSSKTFSTSELTAGKEIVLEIPRGVEAYFRVYYTVGTSNFTGGTLGCWITPDEPQVRTQYPFAINDSGIA